MTSTKTRKHITDLEPWEVSDLHERIRLGNLEQGPVVPVTYEADGPARYSVLVDGIYVGWVVRCDEVPPMDRWQGRVTGTGNLVACTATRGEAGDDVAWEATR